MPVEKSIFTRDYGVFLKTLRRLRDESGRTQSEVAKSLKRTQSVVSKCERGERRLDVIELRAYCNGIGIDFQEFAKILESDLAVASRGTVSLKTKK
jgi:transcriptional regulator with XRE-family HTH domain